MTDRARSLVSSSRRGMIDGWVRQLENGSAVPLGRALSGILPFVSACGHTKASVQQREVPPCPR